MASRKLYFVTKHIIVKCVKLQKFKLPKLKKKMQLKIILLHSLRFSQLITRKCFNFTQMVYKKAITH